MPIYLDISCIPLFSWLSEHLSPWRPGFDTSVIVDVSQDLLLTPAASKWTSRFHYLREQNTHITQPVQSIKALFQDYQFFFFWKTHMVTNHCANVSAQEEEDWHMGFDKCSNVVSSSEVRSHPSSHVWLYFYATMMFMEPFQKSSMVLTGQNMSMSPILIN